MMKVTGLGQCALDNLFTIDAFPAPDTKKEIIEYETAGGGPVATALVSLARLGVKCSYYGIVGDDEAGEKIRASLEDEGIDTGGLVQRPDSHSQIAFIAIEKETGKRNIFWKRPSGAPYKSDELADDFLDNTDFFLTDGLMAESSTHAAKIARSKNIPVMVDAGRIREGMLELADHCDYFVCSEEFAREFTGNVERFDPDKAIQKMNTFKAETVTITLGAQGSITRYKDNVFHTHAFDVDVVDTTGAGDVFHGGYIYGLLQKWDIQKVVSFASAFAALKCTKMGGRAAIPALDDVDRLLKESI
jgi:ribokinase